MVQRSSVRRRRQLIELGENIRRWRAVNEMSAAQLAERAAVTRQTLRALEAGEGGRVDSLMAVLQALGLADRVIAATDPFKSDTARSRIDSLIARNGSF